MTNSKYDVICLRLLIKDVWFCPHTVNIFFRFFFDWLQLFSLGLKPAVSHVIKVYSIFYFGIWVGFWILEGRSRIFTINPLILFIEHRRRNSSILRYPILSFFVWFQIATWMNKSMINFSFNLDQSSPSMKKISNGQGS